VLFLVAAALYAVAAARDLLFPHFFNSGSARPASSAALACVFLIVGIAARRKPQST